MIIWVFIFLSCISSILTSCLSGLQPIFAIMTAFFLYFIFCITSFGLVWVLSLLLGRTDKFVLKKNSKYKIISLDDNKIKVLNRLGKIEEVSKELINETIKSADVVSPYLEIKSYNVGGWCGYWLFQLHEDKEIYIIYLPMEEDIECGQ